MSDPKGSILVVDDDESIRNSLSQIFVYLRYRTRSAEDGIAALVEMRREIPDILISDLNMPNMSGFELLSVVRRRFPAVRVIAMSGVFSEDAIPCGVTADAFYQKGGGMDELLKTVEKRPWPAREPASAPDPIWIQRNGHDSSGGEFVTIACPDCFRTFPMPINNAASLILDTTCKFCQCLILYAVVDPYNVGFPPRYVPTQQFAEPPVTRKVQLSN